MALCEIIYTSRASRALLPEELAQLLDKARAHNASQGITGMMIDHRRGFSDWGMAFVAPDELALSGKPGYQDLLDQGMRQAPGDSNGKTLLLTLRDEFLCSD